MNCKHYRVKHLTVHLLLALFLCTGCVTTPDPVQPGKLARIDGQAPKTLAILPFENNSVTDRQHFEPLGKGLSAMLITDLDKNGSALKLIERSKIESLLKEVALGQGGVVDQSTAVEVGKILGAQSIAFGSFMVLGNQVRIDVRIIKVETSELIISESITGGSDRFMDLEGKLALKIADSLRVALAPAATVWDGSLNAALAFSNGLEALDTGDTVKARQFFQKSIDLDPAFQSQVDGIKGLK